MKPLKFKNGDLFTREEWLEMVDNHSLIDYDGMGDEVDKDGEIITVKEQVFDTKGKPVFNKHGELAFTSKWIQPSRAHELQVETTHILWYNR